LARGTCGVNKRNIVLVPVEVQRGDGPNSPKKRRETGCRERKIVLRSQQRFAKTSGEAGRGGERDAWWRKGGCDAVISRKEAGGGGEKISKKKNVFTWWKTGNVLSGRVLFTLNLGINEKKTIGSGLQPRKLPLKKNSLAALVGFHFPMGSVEGGGEKKKKEKKKRNKTGTGWGPVSNPAKLEEKKKKNTERPKNKKARLVCLGGLALSRGVGRPVKSKKNDGGNVKKKTGVGRVKKKGRLELFGEGKKAKKRPRENTPRG